MIKNNKMTDRELFDFLDDNHKKFYKKWYMECCEVITQHTKKNMSVGDCISFLHTYFNQVKMGRMN